MKWKLTDRPSAVVVEMNSNLVNKQNPDYFTDVHEAFDALDRDFPQKPIILTGSGRVFSAGIDFDYCFPLFGRGKVDEVSQWFTDYRKSMMRIFTVPRMTIAAVNGHAFAGGLILAMSCDFRVGAQGDSKFSLNEVPIGIPMPSVYTELLRFRLGSRVASDMILLGQVYDCNEASTLGVLNKIVPKEQLIDSALKMTSAIHPDCWPAFGQSKKSLLHPVLKAIDDFSGALDEDTYRVMVSESSTRMHRRKYENLKAK